MAITYHAGRRIQGTSTDFGTAGAGIPAVAGGWVELGRTTLGGTSNGISVASLPDKRYYKVLWNLITTTSTNSDWRLNNDSGANYAIRESVNGVADGAYGSLTEIPSLSTVSYSQFGMTYISNLPSKEKLSIQHVVGQNTAGAGNAPTRMEEVGKWANTSDSINRFDMNDSGTGNYDTGSEVVVLGWDDSDTHSTNFWEELASVSGDGTGGFSSGTLTAKKYLWVQAWCEPSTSGFIQLRFNSDSGSNYARRQNNNGLTDAAVVNQDSIIIGGTESTPQFFNVFIINNSANEKLVISHTVTQMTAGAANAPERRETVGKWANTSSQITDIEILPNTGNLSTSSIMKIWGSN
jgi:hypothetical protein